MLQLTTDNIIRRTRLCSLQLQRRCMSGLDLDALLAANRYGGNSQKKPELSLDVILNEHRCCTTVHVNDNNKFLISYSKFRRYGGQLPLEAQKVVEIAPEYPYDIDVGPLFCTNAQRCFLVPLEYVTFKYISFSAKSHMQWAGRWRSMWAIPVFQPQQEHAAGPLLNYASHGVAHAHAPSRRTSTRRARRLASSSCTTPTSTNSP